MWKSVVGHDVSVSVETQGDDWDTDPDFVNDISEKEQRWGAKTIEGSGRTEHINIHQLRNKVSEEHDVLKKKEMEAGPKASHGYGGRFGVERDRMDKSAVGHEYVAEVEKHSSQTDAAKGFGGKYGVERDRADKVSDHSLSRPPTSSHVKVAHTHLWMEAHASLLEDRAVDAVRT
uniref:Hematopoietic cell-specific Lyn substrate 1 n=1 Tax=Macaca mulatta TaxID=9544 RepID=A0A5F8ABV9_MACMU